MKRVLFVDNDDKALEGLKLLLRPLDGRWEMVFANSAQAALDLFDEAPFDVVAADMFMPDMSGPELLKRIQDRFPHTVRIVMMAKKDVDVALKTVLIAHQFIAKPYELAVLDEVIERACNLHALLDNEMIKRTVGSMTTLPSLPHTHMALTQTLADSGATIKDVAKIVEKDMSMCVKILQLVNSSYFGLPRRMTNIRTPDIAL